MRMCCQVLVFRSSSPQLVRLQRLFYQNEHTCKKKTLSLKISLLFLVFSFSLKIFWQTFNRVVGKLRENEASQQQKENVQIDSDLIYFKSESKRFENLLSHFILLLNNDVINSIQYYYVLYLRLSIK